jgi:hypothetical protein
MWITNWITEKSKENQSFGNGKKGKEIHISNVYKLPFEMWIMWIT